MKILVTGGAGYIGSHMVKMLCDLGYSVVVIDSLVTGHKKLVDRRAKFIKSCISSKNVVKKALQDCHTVMHFAGCIEVGISMKNPLKFFENNDYFGVILLEAMTKSKVKNIIFSSTAAIYGDPRYTPIDEMHPQEPTNFYGQSKLFFEQLLDWYSKIHGINHISLRYFNAAGADESGSIGELHSPETHIIPLVLQVALKQKKSFRIFGTDYKTYDGTCIRDYVHVNDICKAHMLALKYLIKNKKNNCFNLGIGKGVSVRDVILSCQGVTGEKINTIEGKRREVDTSILVASSDKASKILGWKPKYTEIDSIIKTAWNWHRNNV